MKVKFFAIAMLMMTSLAIPAFGQGNSSIKAGPDAVSRTTCETPCPEKQVAPGPGRFNPYEGLNLTDSQRDQLNKLDEQRRAAVRDKANKKGKDAKAAKQARRQMRQQADSAKMAARKAERRQYLDQVKAIVGPEQYVVFLENFYLNQAPGRPGQKMMPQGKSRKIDGKQARKLDRNGKKTRKLDGAAKQVRSAANAAQ